MPDRHPAEHSEPHWGYDGPIAPESWGQLSPEFALCGLGRAQSPIDLVGATPAAVAPVTYAYQPTPLVILNNGHTIQVNCGQPNGITLDGVRYDLLQFHFHAPSEHTVAGRHAAMEVHLVHRSAQGELAVVGVLIEHGAWHPGLAGVWAHLPAKVGPAQDIPGVSVDPQALLPPNRRGYRYEGSLTTPPCSEGVHWIVLADPIEMSPIQVAAFEAIMRGNYRPVQPLNDRTIWIER
jgi:carbonic anhydrase